MKVFVLFILLQVIFLAACEESQKMTMPVAVDGEPEQIDTEPVPEPTTTEYTYYIDGVAHTGIAYLTADAALATEQYQNLLTYFKEWNDASCGKPLEEKAPFDWDRVDDFIFYFTTFEEMNKFNKITESHRDIKQYAPEDAPIPEEENGVWGILLEPTCF